MIRALWTAASGMTSQQLNVDTISNNLANVNTVGYKREATNFKSLLYQNLTGPNDEVNRPEPMQVGHGVRAVGSSRNYSMGILQQTDNPTDIAIEGKGFFSVLKGEQITYTRDGSFRFSMTEDGTYALVTSDGYPVLSTEGEPIVMDNTIPVDSLRIGMDGSLGYMDEATNTLINLTQINIVQFPNVNGLEAIGSNLYIETPASGVPISEAEGEDLVRSNLKSGYLEGSNVQVADEMVKLIVAQRAYELNSTTIKTVDTMLQQANELKRG